MAEPIWIWSGMEKKSSNLRNLEGCFMFRDRFYKITSGVAMGNLLSPLLNERFVSLIEEEIDSRGIIPKVWFRYVDDVFAVVRRDDIDMVISSINKINHNIEFTLEVEKDGALPFLDLNIVNSSEKLKFEIYRKSTATQRMIPANTRHTFPQEMAAYNCLIRLIAYPFWKYGFNKERQHIVDTVIKNACNPETIEKLIVRKIKHPVLLPI